MTICIAALCRWPTGGNIIVGASDRKLSAIDIQFEPPQQKMYTFLPWVAALVAGDPYLQVSICESTFQFLEKKKPKTVEEVASVYAEKFSDVRRRAAETKYLKPLGMDANEFMNRQRDFSPDFVTGLKIDLQSHSIDVEAIITGTDAETGIPHIFLVSDPGQMVCADAVAFASIGSGKHHSDSQFMQRRHTRNAPWQETLLLTYIAKKRAEVSPTVGQATDLFFIMNGQTTTFSDEVHQKINAAYERLEERIRSEMQTAANETVSFLDEIGKRPQQNAVEVTGPLPSAPEDAQAPRVGEPADKPPKPRRKPKVGAT